MEEGGREVERRSRGDGEGLKSAIKEPICQKCKFSPSTETKQDAFDFEKQGHKWFGENAIHTFIHMFKNKSKKKSPKHLHPLPQTLNPVSHLNWLQSRREKQGREADGFFQPDPRKSEEKDTYRATSLWPAKRKREEIPGQRVTNQYGNIFIQSGEKEFSPVGFWEVDDYAF